MKILNSMRNHSCSKITKSKVLNQRLLQLIIYLGVYRKKCADFYIRPNQKIIRRRSRNGDQWRSKEAFASSEKLH